MKPQQVHYTFTILCYSRSQTGIYKFGVIRVYNYILQPMRTCLHKSIPEGDFHFSDKGPKTVKVFLNQPQTLSFDQAEGMAAVQDFV